MQVQKLRSDIGLFTLRLGLGTVFMYHGSQKLFGAFGGHGLEGFAGYLSQLGIPFASANALLAASTEFFGGLAILVGLFVPLVSIPVVITMLVAAFSAHQGFNAAAGGNEYPLMLAFATAALGAMGAGNLSVQALLPPLSTFLNRKASASAGATAKSAVPAGAKL